MPILTIATCNAGPEALHARGVAKNVARAHCLNLLHLISDIITGLLFDYASGVLVAFHYGAGVA